MTIHGDEEYDLDVLTMILQDCYLDIDDIKGVIINLIREIQRYRAVREEEML